MPELIFTENSPFNRFLTSFLELKKTDDGSTKVVLKECDEIPEYEKNKEMILMFMKYFRIVLKKIDYGYTIQTPCHLPVEDEDEPSEENRIAIQRLRDLIIEDC